MYGRAASNKIKHTYYFKASRIKLIFFNFRSYTYYDFVLSHFFGNNIKLCLTKILILNESLSYDIYLCTFCI